ncbi:MAG: hypothetical protein AAFV93_02840, partial [Chloroflexota bacterium]
WWRSSTFLSINWCCGINPTTPVNTQEGATPPPTSPPACSSPSVSNVSATTIQDSGVTYYPASPTVSYTLCVPAGHEAWVLVRTINNREYAWGPTTSNGRGSMGVGLGTGAGQQCGESFGLRVVVATAGSIQRNVAYENVPGVVASAGLPTRPKYCD